MGYCPSTLIERAANHAPALDALVPRSALDRILELTSPMPELCGGGVFECGLCEDESIDFELDVLHEDAAQLRRMAVEGSALHVLLERWLHPESLVHAMVSGVRLGFDLPQGPAGVVSTGCLPQLGVRRSFERNGREQNSGPAWLGTLCGELGSDGGASATTHRLTRCVAALPECAAVQRIASLDSGEPQELRLQVAMRRTALLPWLEQIGWSGERSGVFEALALAGESGFSHLSARIDIAAEVSSRLVLELACNDSHRLSARWDELFRRMVDRGLAGGERVAAVRRWWGRRKVREAGAPFKVELQRRFHVALALETGRPMKASAALAFQPRRVLV